MKKFKTSLTRILIFNKRLLKKPSFILILCLIPLFVLSLVFFTKEESGILTITLCAEDNNDPLANEIISSLMSNDGVLIFVKSESVDEAYESVRLGKSDAAWIFEKDLQSKILELKTRLTCARSCQHDMQSIKIMNWRTCDKAGTPQRVSVLFWRRERDSLDEHRSPTRTRAP